MTHFFLGLRMKALILFSLLLLLIFSGLTVLNNKNIRGFFEIERESVLEARKARYHSYFAQSLDGLTLIAQGSFDKFSDYDINAQTRQAWNNLQDGYSIPLRSMVLFDEVGDVFRQFGDQQPSKAVLDWARQLDAHQPFWILDCLNICQIYFATGIAGDDQFGTLMFGLDAFLYFNELTEIGHTEHLLLGAPRDKPEPLLYTTQPLGEDISVLIDKLTGDELANGTGYYDTPSGTLELHSFEIFNTTADFPIYFVIITDVSKQMDHLHDANLNNLLYGGGSLLLALALIALLLKQPLSRVRRVIEVLPLLASSGHHLFRQTIADNQSLFFADETDRLGDAAMQVSQQLERLEKQLIARANELEWIANHDNLTHLPNRRKFESLLSESLADNQPGCLLVIDLDNFKYVNDISGHEAGDEMLRQVATTLQRLLPDSAVIARISGDEFAIYLHGFTIELAEVVAQRMFNLIGQVSVPGQDTIHTASASVGLVAYPIHDNTSAGLMGKADICIFQAKAQGKHCVVVYQNSGQGGDMAHQHYWLELAQNAIQRDCLMLFFQPIKNNKTQKTQHYEVLLRVRDQHGQLQSPYELILAAEKNGYISQIDIWVLKSAMDQLERNLKNNIEDRLAINLSARTFCSEPTINQIVHEFHNRDIPGEMIIFEITETASLPNMEQAQAHIKLLKNIGCAIALDDFGVGYSSFHSLKELDFDYIKIDGSFVKGILQNNKNCYFIEALVGIAHNLGHKTIAEFVENEALEQQLELLGVDYSQGYHIGKPAPASQVWLSERTADVLSLQPHDKQD